MRLGSAFFGMLAELDMTVLASKILTFLLNKDDLELNNNSFTVSKEAKLHIYENLSNIKEEYRYSDLILALTAFSKENKNSMFYRIIERIEGELKQKVSSMRVRDALLLLNAYSYSSRFHPGAFLFYFSIFVFLFFSSLSLSVSLSISISLSLSLSLYFSLIYIPAYLCPSRSLFLSVSLSLYLSFFLFFSLLLSFQSYIYRFLIQILFFLLS